MVKKILIIGCDGLRSDVVFTTETPNLDRLMDNGVYSRFATTEPDTVSGACWSSLLKGVHQDKHQVVGNDFRSKDVRYKSLFYLVKKWNPEIRTIAHSNWKPIIEEILEKEATDISSSGNDDLMASGIASDIQNNRGDVFFVQLDDCDRAGHAHGYSIKSKNYLKQVQETDALIGTMLAAIEKRSASEQWLICVLSDHGGKFKDHGGSSWQEVNIAFIISGNGVKNSGEMKYTPRKDDDFSSTPKIVDCIPIIARFLGMPFEIYWDGTIPHGIEFT